MDKIFKELMLEAIRRDIHAQANKGIQKGFEVLVAIKQKTEDSGKVVTMLVCYN
jgi:hypothetical protein